MFRVAANEKTGQWLGKDFPVFPDFLIRIRCAVHPDVILRSWALISCTILDCSLDTFHISSFLGLGECILDAASITLADDPS